MRHGSGGIRKGYPALQDTRESLLGSAILDETKADALRKDLEDFEQKAGQPHTIFYHADPFEVAADLAGRRGKEITPEEKARSLGRA